MPGRLASALSGLLDALADAVVPPGGHEAFRRASAASSGVTPDGSARLSPYDLLVVLAGLDDGTRWAETVAFRHADAAAYRRVARAMGDD